MEKPGFIRTLGYGTAALLLTTTAGCGDKQLTVSVHPTNGKSAVDGNVPPADTEAPACNGGYNIHDLPQDLKIGSLVIPMASASELDALEATMSRDHVNSFALLGDLPDTVTFRGQSMPLGYATLALKQAATEQQHVPITFALDEEGDKVQRTRKLDGGTHALPSAREQAALDPAALSEMFRNHGEYLKAFGVTTIFGPVTDISPVNADGSWSGDDARLNRTFGGDYNEVTESASAVIAGYKAAGLDTTIKHVPDYGSAQTNTDEETAVLPTDFATLQGTTLPVIGNILATAQPEYAMVNNAILPGLTDPAGLSADEYHQNGHPASVSPAVYDFIEQTWGYQGAMITDALNTGSVQSYTKAGDLISSQERAGAEAIAAGADGIIISLDATDRVVAAIQAFVPQERIDDAAAEMLEAKGYTICR